MAGDSPDRRPLTPEEFGRLLYDTSAGCAQGAAREHYTRLHAENRRLRAALGPEQAGDIYAEFQRVCALEEALEQIVSGANDVRVTKTAVVAIARAALRGERCPSSPAGKGGDRG